MKISSYRADIDGLRAIAVFLVVFNHLGWSLFSGGFIGVDIFFVISGYLITSILLKDIENNKFSISNFYKKRIIRLTPAYFTVIITITIFAWFVFLPNELIKYINSIKYSTMLMANIYIQQEVGNYFSQNVDKVPLLHLWSLGVEEQFYILWPLILFLFIKKIKIKKIIILPLILIIFSLIYAQYEIKNNIEKAYYSMPVRAFELLLGAIICFIPKLKLVQKKTNIIVWFTLLSIFFISIFFNKDTPFPGLLASIPCILTAIIIYLGNSNHIVLNNKLSIFMGRISYPLYLWHWPIIVLANIYMIELNLWNGIIIIIISILLSFLTHKYIEKPSKVFIKSNKIIVIIVGFFIPLFFILFFSKMIELNKGYPTRFSEEIYKKIEALNSSSHIIRKNCIDSVYPRDLTDPDKCYLGIKKENIDFLLIGDSHANSYTGMLDVWAKDANLRGYDITQSSTFYLPGTDRMIKNLSQWEIMLKFRQRNDAITQHLQTTHYDTIILAGSYVPYFGDTVKLVDNKHKSNEEVFLNSFLKSLEIAYKSSNHVILLLDVPRLKDYGVSADCSLRSEILKLNKSCIFSKDNNKRESEKFIKIVNIAKEKFPSLIIVDPTKIFCKNLSCNIDINGIPIYRDRDTNHINYIGSKKLGLEYLYKYGNPLL